MSLVNVRLPRLLWLLLGALVPLLFLLDWAVGTSGRRNFEMQAELAVRLDGGDPLTLAIDLAAEHTEEGVELSGTAPLQQFHYPWKPTPVEASFWLRLNHELLDSSQEGSRLDDFAASLTIKDTTRSDGRSGPPLPCRGNLVIEELRWNEEALGAVSLRVDLLCTSSGPDLAWGTGDERVWMLTGPIALVSDGATSATAPR